MDLDLSEIELAPGLADDGLALIAAAGAGRPDAEMDDEEFHAAAINAAFAAVPRSGQRRLRTRFQTIAQRMEFVRGQRAIKAAVKKSAAEVERLTSLRHIWNRSVVLRAGDRVAVGQVRRRGSAKFKHPNQWDMDAILAIAYSNIGKSAPVSSMFRVGDVRRAHGGSIMQAMTAVAGLTQALQTRELSKVLQNIKADAETSRCLVLLSHYDATPMKCAFGVQASELVPIARFFHWDETNNRWEALRAEKFRAIAQRGLSIRGVLEVFQQRMEVCWATRKGVHQQNYLVPPRILPDQRASAVMAAVESGIPEFSIGALTELCRDLRVIILAECPDASTACRRKLWATHARLPDRVLYVPGTCAAHQIHRVICHNDGKAIVSDVYAMKYVCHLASHSLWLYRKLQQWVEDNLEITVGVEVSKVDMAQWRRHTQDVLEHSLFRRAHRARARQDHIVSDDPAELRAAVDEKKLQRRASMILEMCNADIRLPKPRHIEVGCCPGGPEEVKSKFLLALTEGVGALLNKSGLPAEAKWGSMAAANSELQLAELVHGVFHQVFLLAYPQDRKDGGGGTDDYHAQVHQKVNRARRVVEDIDRRHQLLVFPTPPSRWIGCGSGCSTWTRGAAGCSISRTLPHHRLERLTGVGWPSCPVPKTSNAQRVEVEDS
jgi:hypothetical protein